MKQMSQAAQVAKQIRMIIKAHGAKANVISENFSGGNAVRIYFKEVSAEAYAKIFAEADKFRAGSFNSMEDIYEYRKVDGPSADFIFFYSPEDYFMGKPEAEAA